MGLRDCCLKPRTVNLEGENLRGLPPLGESLYTPVMLAEVNCAVHTHLEAGVPDRLVKPLLPVILRFFILRRIAPCLLRAHRPHSDSGGNLSAKALRETPA